MGRVVCMRAAGAFLIKNQTCGGEATAAPIQSIGAAVMSALDVIEEPRANPLEVIEHIATANNWPFDRPTADEITLLVRGKWTDYQGSFTWMFDLEALHLALAFELKVPEHCRPELMRLTSMINEQ